MFRVPIFRPTQTPDIGESGEAFVFRDFERSRIAAIREAVVDNPGLATILFVGVVLIWTAMLSAGAGLYGDYSLAVNMTPHVAQYTIILGFFFYPLRLIWVPIVVYMATFLYPFYQPFNVSHDWHSLPGMSFQFAGLLFAIHLFFGLLTGLIYRMAYAAGRGRMRPHSLDLFVSFLGYFIFGLICLIQMAVLLRLSLTLPPEVRDIYGFTDNYTVQGFKRILRGSVVVSVFTLVAVEYPRSGQYLRTVLLTCLFPLMVPLQSAGLVLHPELDVIIIGLVIVLSNPAGVGIHACTFGVAAYAALTGSFLNDAVVLDPAAELFSSYSLIGLTLVVLTMVIKGQNDHVIHEKDAAILKLDRARDFAGVGLFAINLDSGRFRLDEAAQRMLGLPSDGPNSVFTATFMPQDQAALTGALRAARGDTRALVLHMASASGAANVLRCFLWAEKTPSAENAAYGIFLDVTDAEERETKLRDALAELSNRQEKQRQLFSIISHELRTPASVISLLIDELDDARDQMPKVQRQMRDATDQLLSVLDDMRQAVNPEKNLPVKLVPYVPAELAESVKNAMSLTARTKGISIKLDLGAGAAQARVGDVTRVRQALTNLVRNAVIHSNGRTIVIAWKAAAPAADFMPITEWRVEDDGIGIPAADIARLFEPFERGNRDARKSADGSGLGLYIARASIQMLGGSLDHYAPRTGGAGYVIRLPEAIATEAPSTDDKRSAQNRPAPSPDRPWTVLLAEDNALVAEITRARLEKQKARVTHALDGRQALNLIRTTPPDLVITDLFMPEMDGDELIRALRQDGYDGPIIGLTAAVVGEEMNRFRVAGANVVMKKPLDFEMLRGFLRDGFPKPDTSADPSRSAD